MNLESMKAGTDDTVNDARARIRMKLWCDAYVAHIPEISAPDGYAKRKATEALEAFDRQFPVVVGGGGGEADPMATVAPATDADQDAADWRVFAQRFEKQDGFAPHPRDSLHKRLFGYFQAGAAAQDIGRLDGILIPLNPHEGTSLAHQLADLRCRRGVEA